ncbi:MAG TPA: CdaR family protein [Chthonomonadaceae bacterium]|nr:CdaR family protein [Chthonomonadaceae bacterium]
MVLWTRLRQNLSLKIVSLVAAVLLYIFVQQERNPTVTRSLLVTIDYVNIQPGLQFIPTSKRIPATVSGPRQSVDRLLDGDIHATADLSAINSSETSAPVRLHYEKPKGASDISLETAPDFVTVQVFRERTRKIEVTPRFQNQPPPGYKYGDATVKPLQVTVRGREDVVNRIASVVAFAMPDEPHANIDGDFTLQARDSDQNVISGVEITPEKVHVTVPQVVLPAEQTVQVKTPTDTPAPPYVLAETVYQPATVKVIGTPQRIANILTITTETLSVHNLTATTTMDAVLIVPPDVKVRDLRGNPISHVKVTFIITKAKPETGAGTDGATPQVKHDGAPTP